MYGDVFFQVATLLLIASAIGTVFVWLRQPLILAFIATGVVVGPSVLGLVYSESEIDLLAKIGITLLLFIVGLKLDFHLIKTLGKVSLFTGTGQIVFTAGIGYGIALLLGMSHISALYLAVALTFSSTIIIIKLLSDKEEIDSLYGRISIGFLIVQDIAVIIAIIVLSSFGIGGTEDTALSTQITMLIVKGLGMLALIALLARYVLPSFLDRLAHSRELLVIFAITWAIFLASSAEMMGFSKEVGGFLAGISLASTDYRQSIASRLDTLRNFLLLFFFIDLGAQIKLDLINTQLVPAIVFSLFVLIGNPLIVMGIMGYMGYKKSTGFMAGLTVAQISEFSLILGALGVKLGHIDHETMGIITLVGVITIGVSSYMILYNHVLYRWLAPWLSIFERKNAHSEQIASATEIASDFKTVIFGLGRYGKNLVQCLNEHGMPILGVDFDPGKIEDIRQRGYQAIYGDAEDIEFIKSLPLKKLDCVVSTVPHREVNLVLLQALKEQNYQGRVVFTTHSPQNAEVYAEHSLDLVLMPYRDAAYTAALKLVDLLEDGHAQ